jgi:hypothetical protein
MLHRPSSGNVTQSSGYYTGIALLGPIGPGVGALDTDVDPRSSDSPLGRPWSGAGGRRLPAPHRISPLLAASQSSDPVAQSALTNEPARPCPSARPAPSRRRAAAAQARVRAAASPAPASWGCRNTRWMAI